MSNGKDTIIHLIVGLKKRPWMKFCHINVTQYFPKPIISFGGNISVKVDLSNYAIKTDQKNIAHIDTSGFALKTNLASLKTEVYKLDIGKLTPVPVDLCKLSDHKLLMLIVKNLSFFPLVLKHTNAVVVAKISKIHRQNCVFLML